jgi:hypothetical protein
MLDTDLKEQLQGYLGRLTQPIEVAAGPVRHVILQPVHFLVEVGRARHTRSKAPGADLFRP